MIPGRTITAAAAILLWYSSAGADPFVKITQPAGKDGTGTSCSSGTLIGWTPDCSNGIFISCAHGYDRDTPLEVEINRDQTIEGRIIAIDRDLDLSLLEAPIDRSMEMVYLASHSPRSCDEVNLIGFPDKAFNSSTTHITGRFWTRYACTPKWTLYKATPRCQCPVEYHELLVTEAPGPPGLSGGALLQNKKLAGVVIGRITNANDAGLVVPAETVRLFVQKNITLFYRR